MGIFGNLFDLNGDGQLDSMEKAIEFGAFMNMVESEDTYGHRKTKIIDFKRFNRIKTTFDRKTASSYTICSVYDSKS